MNSEQFKEAQGLVQIGFFDMEPVASNGNSEITVVADWSALPKNELIQEATEYHDRLEKQEQQLNAIIRFAEEQKKSVIYEKGELYKFMKGKMDYEEWLDWLKSVDSSRSTANEYIQLATDYRTELTANAVGSRLSWRQMRAIHRSGEGHEILAKLESGEVKPTQEGINAELEAVKQRAKELEEKLAEERQAHSLFKDEHFTQIQTLEQKLEEKPEPVKVIEYRDTLETAARFAELKEQIEAIKAKPDITPEKQKELTNLQQELKNAQTQLDFYEKQNKALADKNKQLSEESRRSFTENITAVGRLRIRQEWQFATGEVQAAIRKFHTRIPSDIDLGSFEGEENTRTAQTIDLLIETATLLKKSLLGSDSTVDAQQVPVLASPEVSNSIVIGIPPEYQALFDEYKQAVLSFSDDVLVLGQLLWNAPGHGYIDQMMEPEKHIQFTKELLSSRVDRRIRAALSAMKIVLGIQEG